MIIYALLSSFFWGSLVLVSSKIGGTAYSQLKGLTIGNLLFAIVSLFLLKNNLEMSVFIIGLISGFFWSIGQMYQFVAIKKVGISKALPVSTGMCLLVNTFIGILLFNEWSNNEQFIIGYLGVMSIIIGVYFISAKKNNEQDVTKVTDATFPLIISTIGFVTYVTIISYYQLDSWLVLFPQAIGMFITSNLLSFKRSAIDIYVFKNIVTGFIWALGNLFLMISLKENGFVISYSISQTGIVISTLGGIFLLKEVQSKKNILITLAGCLFVILGGILLTFSKG